MGDFAEFFSEKGKFETHKSGVPNMDWHKPQTKNNKKNNNDTINKDLNYSKPLKKQNYDILNKPHPSDTGGIKLKKNMEESKKKMNSRKKDYKKIKKSKNTISNEIKMIELKNEKCSNKEYPYLKSYFGRNYCVKDNIKHIQESLNDKEFCYLDDNIHPDLVKYYAKNNIKQCISSKQPKPKHNKYKQMNSQSVNDYININQRGTSNPNQRPINIYMSCNNNVDEQGYGGSEYIYEKCLNKKGKLYKDTLKDYYIEQSSGDRIDNKYLRRRRWKDKHINNRDFYRELDNFNIRPNMSLTQPDTYYKENTIGGHITNNTRKIKGYNLL